MACLPPARMYKLNEDKDVCFACWFIQVPKAVPPHIVGTQEVFVDG